MRFLSRGARFSAKRRRAAQGHKDAQHGKARTGLPEGVAHRAHEGAGGYHEQAVDHAVHAGEGGPLVAGDDVIEPLVLVQEVGADDACTSIQPKMQPSTGAAPTSAQPPPQSRAQTA